MRKKATDGLHWATKAQDHAEGPVLRHLFLDESDGVKSWLHEQHPVTTSTARRLIAKDFLSGDPQRELEARSSSKKPKITNDKDKGQWGEVFKGKQT